MGFFESLASKSSSMVSSPGALKKMDNRELSEMKSQFLETMSKNESGSQLHESCKRGIENIEYEMRTRGIY